MDFEELTPEQQEKARQCKSAEEIFALAEQEGIQLTDEQLDAIAGGSWYSSTCNPKGYYDIIF